MRSWDTFGAHGDTVVELSLRDVFDPGCGSEVSSEVRYNFANELARCITDNWRNNHVPVF